MSREERNARTIISFPLILQIRSGLRGHFLCVLVEKTAPVIVQWVEALACRRQFYRHVGKMSVVLPGDKIEQNHPGEIVPVLRADGEEIAIFVV